jgi:hypothetical protein
LIYVLAGGQYIKIVRLTGQSQLATVTKFIVHVYRLMYKLRGWSYHSCDVKIIILKSLFIKKHMHELFGLNLINKNIKRNIFYICNNWDMQISVLNNADYQ